MCGRGSIGVVGTVSGLRPPALAGSRQLSRRGGPPSRRMALPQDRRRRPGAEQRAEPNALQGFWVPSSAGP